MAATIRNELGFSSTLMEGHKGIFEVTVNGNLIYTNRGSRTKFPITESIIQELSKYSIGKAGTLVEGVQLTAANRFNDGNSKEANLGGCSCSGDSPGHTCNCSGSWNEPKTTLNPIAVCKLLPQLNCNKCGFSTCQEFAESLIRGDSEPEDCTPLMEPKFTKALFQLQKVITGR